MFYYTAAKQHQAPSYCVSPHRTSFQLTLLSIIQGNCHTPDFNHLSVPISENKIYTQINIFWREKTFPIAVRFC
jgi:hypothetical protein